MRPDRLVVPAAELHVEIARRSPRAAAPPSGRVVGIVIDMRVVAADRAGIGETFCAMLRLLPPRPRASFRARSCCPARAARCISTVSTQRPNLNPTAGRIPDMGEAERLVQADRCDRLAPADHRDHLAIAEFGAARRSAAAAARGRCRARFRRRRYRSNPPAYSDIRRAAGTGRHSNSRRPGRRARRPDMAGRAPGLRRGGGRSLPPAAAPPRTRRPRAARDVHISR